MKKVLWTFDSEAENNLKLVCIRLNENVLFHESFSNSPWLVRPIGLDLVAEWVGIVSHPRSSACHTVFFTGWYGAFGFEGY